MGEHHHRPHLPGVTPRQWGAQAEHVRQMVREYCRLEWYCTCGVDWSIHMHQKNPTSGVSFASDSMTLVERALDLCLPPMLDRLPLDSYLVLAQKDITAQLAHMPVDVNYPNFTYNVQRGIIPGRCFGSSFTTWLAGLTVIIPEQRWH